MPPRRWYPGSLLLWTYLLVLGSGCASIPLGRWASREREPVISRKTQTASREKNKDDSPRTLLRSKSKSEKSERPPAIADAAAKPPRPLDPATQMLIDSELKSLPTEERQRWKSYLASVEPSKIPNILQNRNEGVIPPEVAESSKETTAASSNTSRCTGRALALSGF